MTTRRAWLRNLAGASVAFGLWPNLACSRKKGRRTGSGMHSEIAREASKLSSSRPLIVLYPKGSLANLRPIAAEFRKQTGQALELVEASLDEISAEIIVRNQNQGSKNRFDIALPATFGIPDLVESGAIERLDELAEQFQPKGFAATSIYTLGDKYKGQLYGYQADGDAYLMFYQKEWLENAENKKRYFDEHGIELHVPLTWSELDRQIRFFHNPDAGRLGGSLFRTPNYIAWEYWVRLHAQGLFPVDDSLVPRFNTEKGTTALSELIATTSFLDPRVKEHDLFANFESFAKGDKFCNIGWGGTQKFLNGPNSQVRGRLAHGPVPGGMIGGSATPMPYFNWGWNYVLSSKSRSKKLAYLFVLFASTPKMSTLAVREQAGYFDPHRTEHYQDSAIQEIYSPEFLKVHEQSLGACIPDFYLRGQGRYMGSLRRVIHSVSEGQVPIDRALLKLQNKWNAITDELGRDKQKRQWTFLRGSYPAHLQRALA